MAEIGDLVIRARAGDGEAFEQLVRLHMRAAHTVALAVTGGAADAEDVVQDAFVTALERLDDCEPGRFSGWLLSIVRNRALNVRRAQAVRSAAPMHVLESTSSNSSPERDAERARLRGDLTAALARLTETQRQVVLLYDLEGYKHREIGELIGISEGASRFHLSTARAALRGLLDGQTGDKPCTHGIGNRSGNASGWIFPRSSSSRIDSSAWSAASCGGRAAS
ncbi:MAG: RNA polymerase sigma factor [Gemmatimonadota bacterium]